jgi:hypothetical protein
MISPMPLYRTIMPASITPPDTQGIPESYDGDVLAVGEAVLERAKAISRQLSEKVRQLTNDAEGQSNAVSTD